MFSGLINLLHFPPSFFCTKTPEKQCQCLNFSIVMTGNYYVKLKGIEGAKEVNEYGPTDSLPLRINFDKKKAVDWNDQKRQERLVAGLKKRKGYEGPDWLQKMFQKAKSALLSHNQHDSIYT